MKKLSRILSLILALCLLLALCSTAVMAEEKQHKIGFSYFSATDSYALLMIDALQKSCDAVGAEFVYMDWLTMDMEGMVASYQSLIEQGCDGILVNILTPGIVNLCDRTGTSFVVSHGYINDASLWDMLTESEAFAGHVICDDYSSGTEMVKALEAAGCRHLAFIGPIAGQAPQKDASLQGALDYIENASDIEMTTVYQGDDYLTTALLQVATAYPEVDAFILPNGDMVPQMYNEGLTDKIKIATVDMSAELATTTFDDGVLCAYAGTEASAAIIYPAFAILYNHMTGHDLIEDKTQTLTVPYVMVTNSEEYAQYKSCFNSEAPLFTAEEIQRMIVEFNPDCSFESIKEVADSFTLEGFAARSQSR